MKQLLLIFLASLTLINFTFIAQAQSTKRDISNYQAGAVFDFNGEFLGKAEDAKQSLREYLWDVWNSKTQSYFRVNSYTREGDLIACNYYVERSETDSWLIIKECISNQCPYVSKKACRNIKPTNTIYDRVEKVNKISILTNGERIWNNEFIIVLSNSKSEHKIEF